MFAGCGFIVPQEVPLVWFPLNKPGDDILYLEIKCAADGDGDVKIYENLTRGINELDTINWPISATEQTFTYTFPLPDAPLVELRLDPPGSGVSLDVDSLRIIDRRGAEIQRFPIESVVAQNQIQSITPTDSGWRLTSVADANDPFVQLELYAPVVAKGINQRNLLRCVLSTGYLAMMLLIILLTVLFTFWRPNNWRAFGVHVGFMAYLALMFAAVGNRGLIKNSIHYAQFEAPSPPHGLRLELDVNSSGGSTTQLFWDSSNGFSEEESSRKALQSQTTLQTVRFDLPSQLFSKLRLDPRDDSGWLDIRGIRVVDLVNHTKAVIPLDTLQPAQHIESIEGKDRAVRINTVSGVVDPILLFTSDAVKLVNDVIKAQNDSTDS